MVNMQIMDFPSRGTKQKEKQQPKATTTIYNEQSRQDTVHDMEQQEEPTSADQEVVFDAIPVSSSSGSTATATAISLWEDPSSRLPLWMKDYFTWHRQQRSHLNHTNWKQFRFLIMQCRQHDSRCGGTADRLKPIPYLLLIAAQTQRLLLITWERPHALEEFLVPPQGGVDWRTPSYLPILLWGTKPHNRPAGSHRSILKALHEHPNATALCVKYQSNSGDDYYEERRRHDEPTFVQVYPELWRIMFTPSPPIAQLFWQHLTRLNLTPRSYVAAHIRANYGKFGKLDKRVSLTYYLNGWSKSSMDCASQLLPHAPILVVSDSIEAINKTMEYGNRHTTSRVVARLLATTTTFADHSSSETGAKNASQHQRQSTQLLVAPLHLEKSDEWQQRPPSDYYDTFVDLYLMAMARCVVYNLGGFGHWAMLIGSWNVSSICGLQYYEVNQGFRSCENNHPNEAFDIPSQPLEVMQSSSSTLLFLPPMSNHSEGNERAINAFTPRYYPLSIGDDSHESASFAEKSPGSLSFERISYTDSPSFPNSTILPDWMKEYFTWHREQRQRITMDNWRSFKYMVVRCRKSRRCGGTADRLKPIPFFVLIAHQSKRILMINWERPKPLEDFLVPPKHGIDWRVPDFLVWKVARDNYPKNTLEKIQRAMNDTQAITLTVRYQSFNSGSDYYDQYRPGGPTFAEVYRELWHTVFTPSPLIAARIEDEMEQLGLVPGQYVAAHVRSNYTSDPKRYELERWTKNSIHCASQLMPGATTFFASDSSLAIDIAKEYGTKRNGQVVVRSHDKPPLHLEKAVDWETRPASDYYDTFVDLYLLGMSGCVTYNQGGFGSWASLISFNSSCAIQHHQANGHVEDCEWNTADTTAEMRKASRFERPLFAEPMPYPNLWETASKIPTWMKEYFAWHADQVSNLNPNNWNSKRYLVIICLKENEQCGGVSDRLKTLPLLLLIAHRTNRLLMIWWERPCDIEEFMAPPKGGLDWRVPPWLRPMILEESKMVTNLDALLSFAPDRAHVVRVLYQSANAGSSYFNQTDDAKTTYEEVFHELFRIVFTPSPALAEVIEDTMKQYKLTEGEYASAHLRAMYGRTSRDPIEIKHLAINAAMCASKLRPGGPVYFAGDSKLAVDSVRTYARRHSLPIATYEYEGEALHLDKDSKNETLSLKPADFFPTFVDLYLLAKSSCVAYSNGGFGTFGLALSYNSSCSFRHFRRRRATQTCRWQKK
jgi:hypothetical protein